MFEFPLTCIGTVEITFAASLHIVASHHLVELLDYRVLDVVRRHLGQYQLFQSVGRLLTAHRPQLGVQVGVSPGQLVPGAVGSVGGQGVIPGAGRSGHEAITADHDAALATGQVEVEDCCAK